MADPTTPTRRAPSKLRQAVRLLRGLLAGHRRLFLTAVGGASVYAICTVLSAFVVRLVTDRVITPRFTTGHVAVGTVLGVLGLVIGVALVRAAGVVVRRVWAGRTAWRVNEGLTRSVVQRYVDQPVPWHRRQTAGDLISRAGLDAEAATTVLNPLPFASSVIVMLVISSAWMLVTDAVLGLFAVALFPILIGLNLVYQRRADRYYDAAQDELGRLSAAVHESFDGVTVVKSLGAEQRETERLGLIAGRLRDARMGAVRVRSTFEALLDGIPNAANTALLVVGAYRVRAGAATVGELASFFYLFTLLVFPLRLIGFVLSDLPHSLAGWNRVREVLDAPVQPDPARTLGRSPDGAVRLHGVHYRHEGARDVLDGVDAEIPAGRTVAVVGATGAGKTTLLHLVAGLIEPSSGRIEVPAGDTLLVFQEPFLTVGTVRENVTLGRPIADRDVDEAVVTACAEFCYDLPNGLATMVGERGVGLSGGQRQRIALARALVRRPAVLLLDDTTSALDPATEAAVLANLRRQLGSMTVLAVASRPSTIALADDVLYLVDGVVAAHGRHEALLAGVPGYRTLIEAFEHDRAALDAAAGEDAGEAAEATVGAGAEVRP